MPFRPHGGGWNADVERAACTQGHSYPETAKAGQKRKVCSVCRNKREAAYREARRTESGAVGLRRLKSENKPRDFWMELARG